MSDIAKAKLYKEAFDLLQQAQELLIAAREEHEHQWVGERGHFTATFAGVEATEAARRVVEYPELLATLHEQDRRLEALTGYVAKLTAQVRARSAKLDHVQHVLRGFMAGLQVHLDNSGHGDFKRRLIEYVSVWRSDLDKAKGE